MPKGLKGFQKGIKIRLGKKHTELTRKKMSETHTDGMSGKHNSKR